MSIGLNAFAAFADIALGVSNVHDLLKIVRLVGDLCPPPARRDHPRPAVSMTRNARTVWNRFCLFKLLK